VVPAAGQANLPEEEEGVSRPVSGVAGMGPRPEGIVTIRERQAMEKRERLGGKERLARQQLRASKANPELVFGERERAELAERKGQRSAVITAFVQRVTKREQFSVSWLRRTQNQEYVRSIGMAAGQDSAKPKPNGLHIAEMFDAKFMVPGKSELPPGTHGLRIPGLLAGHVPTCELCMRASSEASDTRTHEECYFTPMVECVRCGWHPPMEEREVIEQYDCSTGNRNTVTFKAAFDEQMSKLLQATEHAGPVLVPYVGDPQDLTINRLGLALKSSDLARAREATGIVVDGPESLAEANLQLEKLKQLPIKARLTTDATGSGVNSAAMVPGFSYPTIHDAVSLIRRDDYLGKGDVERYYMLFPLAEESRHLFGAVYEGSFYWFMALFFGFAAGACYASIWSAELRRWVLHRGVRPVHMMDDWMVSERTEAAARAAMGIIAAVFLAAGIHMAPRKYEYGQRLLFLGILFDTVRMSMSFDPVQCSDFARILREASAEVGAGRDLSATVVSSIAGKLNWYGSLLQVGRLHDRAWWRYLSTRKQPKGRRYASAELRQSVTEDSAWWVAQLDTWARGGLGGNEFPSLPFRL
jgi:hypothetical protein